MNREFLQNESITHIVNTAKGLEMFGPKYLVRTFPQTSACWNVKASVVLSSVSKHLG